MMKFKVGDLVRVKTGTEDVLMPDGRIGLIIEEVLGGRRDLNHPVHFTSIWRIWMTNGSTLKFHEMFLEHVKRNIE